jgi:hypothetical protein
MSRQQSELTAQNWFEQLIGRPESEFNYTLAEVPTEHQPAMGQFSQPTINELKALVTTSFGVNNPNGVKLQVDYRTSYGHMHAFDTSALQFTAPENALFQVASNFNCLEVPKMNYDPFNGYFLTGQMTDMTQGPSASGGAAFGAMLRLLEHRIKPIDLLSNVPEISSKNGKVPYDWNSNVNILEIDQIKVGLHRNVRATFRRMSDNFAYNPKGPLINQVFTSTCICENTLPNGLSRSLLEAAYEGTYLSAVVTKAPMVVLTLIGGGVFCNNHKLIIDAMMKAHDKYSQYLAKDCIVKLPIFTPCPKAEIVYLARFPSVVLTKVC